MTTLKLENLTATYSVGRTGRLVRALHCASLDVRGGEIVGLIGESGSGKSTIGRAIAGLEARNCVVSAGTIAVDDELYLSGAGDQRRELRGREVGYIFQHAQASFDPLLTVRRQFLELLARRFGGSLANPSALMARSLAEVGLGDTDRVLDSRPHQLSGGMAQRVAIAFALAAQPRFLVADEATSALDVDSRRTVVDVMRAAVAERGLGVVFITHDIALAESVCDRVFVMYGGETVEVYNPATDPMRHRYSIALRAATPAWVPRQTLVPIPGMQERRTPHDVGCPFVSRCTAAIDACSTAHIPPDSDGKSWHRCLNPAPLGVAPMMGDPLNGNVSSQRGARTSPRAEGPREKR